MPATTVPTRRPSVVTGSASRRTSPATSMLRSGAPGQCGRLPLELGGHRRALDRRPPLEHPRARLDRGRRRELRRDDATVLDREVRPLARGPRLEDLVRVVREAPGDQDVEPDRAGRQARADAQHDGEAGAASGAPAACGSSSPDRVADAVHGLELGASGEAPQLAPQAGDVGVQRVVVDDRAVWPARADELTPPDGLPGRANSAAAMRNSVGVTRTLPARRERVERGVEGHATTRVGSAPREPRRTRARRRATSSSSENGLAM